MIELPVFKEKKCAYLYVISVSLLVLEILFPNLHEGKNCKIFLRFWTSSDLAIVFGTNQTCSSMPMRSY